LLVDFAAIIPLMRRMPIAMKPKKTVYLTVIGYSVPATLKDRKQKWLIFR